MDEDFVVWSDDFSVEFAPLDEQHKKLVVITNDLLKNCKEGSGVSKIDFMLLFSKASEYAITHFRDEEDYMKKAAYPNFEDHKKEHENFLAEVKSSFNKFKESDAAPMGLAVFLKKWLLNHIAVKDKLYSPYLAKL
jgi:hemerythrin